MERREQFSKMIAEGRKVSSLIFIGALDGWDRNDAAWLRRQLKAGRIIKVCGGHPFYRAEYLENRPA